MRNKGVRLTIRIISAAVSVLLMALIFYFSAQNGEKSGEISQGVAENIGSAIVPDVASPSVQAMAEFVLSYIRKFAHIFLYAALGLSVSVCAFTFPTRRRWLWWVVPLAVCFLYACSDELHQLFVPGRGASFSDVLVDAIGFATAIVLANAARCLFGLLRGRERP